MRFFHKIIRDWPQASGARATERANWGRGGGDNT